MTEQDNGASSKTSFAYELKIAIVAISSFAAIYALITRNILLLFLSLPIAVSIGTDFIQEDDSDGFFNDGLEPGSEKLNLCPNCGTDQLSRSSTTLTSLPSYKCENCGHEPSKKEAEKSVTDMLVEEGSEGTGSVGQIKNDELRQEVRDRLEEGWEVDEVDNAEEKVILQTTEGGTIGGHALTGITTGLWTFGAGNIVYNSLSKKKNGERLVLREQDALPEDTANVDQIPDLSAKLRELKNLNDDGIITDEEFDQKKNEILEEY